MHFTQSALYSSSHLWSYYLEYAWSPNLIYIRTQVVFYPLQGLVLFYFTFRYLKDVTSISNILLYLQHCYWFDDCYLYLLGFFCVLSSCSLLGEFCDVPLLFCFVLSWDRVSVCSSGCSKTHYVPRAGLGHTEISFPLPPKWQNQRHTPPCLAQSLKCVRRTYLIWKANLVSL